MKKILLSLAFCFVTVFAFAQQVADNKKVFGTGVTGETAPFAQIEQLLGDKQSADMKLRGKVVEVCQKKGCFITVQMPDGKEPVRVTFKDYAFFMPFDLAGKEILLDGVAKKQIVSVETLRHYAEDAHKSEAEIAKITEPKKEVAFEAKGVVILN
ncbi:DUF4920 domain-containing protein [Pedobacter flavus]|uniref:DUF4920 domain-containing protein n=1 Tax=Pedobacter flavus TaxID=3113906 RepID=A0ABU7GZE7_9SPHI|nr:DUF4920 domain-containing protein [Pedobacter sp. VNH31]MEE1884320.1 DUF4920 domain-containing protein [Pedobacter sp. VNH31]